MEILRIENLSFSYPESGIFALKDVSANIDEGEFVLLCGESGCGKSTLLRLLKRELSPFGTKEGDIYYCGKLTEEIDERTLASQVGFIFQNPDKQIVTDTVWHELAFGLENLGIDRQIMRRRVAEMASYFGIEGWFHKKTSELSGGQKQLLNLASVMVMNPKLLLLDEPTAQLDPIAAANFISTLYKLNRESGITIIMAEHHLEEIFPIADKVMLMENGKLSYFDKPKNITGFFEKNPQSKMRQALPSAMRIFSLLNAEGQPPVTVREGRNYLAANYANKFDALPDTPYNPIKEKSVELKDVFFRYERRLPDVISSANLQVYKNEHFCIVGGNGAGKSTLLELIAGIKKAYRGKVLIDKKHIEHYKNNELYIKKIAFLPQNPQTLFLEDTVKDDLNMICQALGYTISETEEKTANVVKLLGIDNLLNRHPFDLSGGEEQKAALAKLLLTEPEILLLDEPTKGLHTAAKQDFAEIIALLKSKGVTIITVTHDIEFAAESADRVGLLFDGEFVCVDTANKFFAENNFYTTAANRISRGFYKNAVLCCQVAELCRKNGRRSEPDD